MDTSEPRIVITGATSGIGLAAARILAERGVRLVLACRNMEKATAVRAEIGGATDLVHLDLASLASVRECARSILERYGSLDVLVNNAGLFSMTRRETEDGFELTIGVNHLGPFLLTNLLLPGLRAAPRARIVNVASAAYRYARLNLDDIQRTRWTGNAGFAGFQAYGASRLATVLFTIELARRLEGSGVTANCCHPGHVATSIFPQAKGLMGVVMRCSSRFRRSSEDGAGPVVRLAVNDDVREVSGAYFNRYEPEQPNVTASDRSLAARLWETSALLTGFHEAREAP